jgi:hypothetical protein
MFSAFCQIDDLLQAIQSTSGLAVILFIKTMFHPSEKIPELVSFYNCTSLRIRHMFENLCILFFGGTKV